MGVKRPELKQRSVWCVLMLGISLLAAPLALRAGDILRGGGVSGSSRQGANARSTAGAEAAAAAQDKAQDRLARTTQALAAVRAMQVKARTTAPTVVVPDGLTGGGLKVLAGANARWDGADLPKQNGGQVIIRQNQEQAILHWETFNVGRNTEVRFDQSQGKSEASKWIAFNKVFDPSGKPSQILGSIKAEGQVYVLNQNGILFGRNSQVNVRSLVAASLPINDNLIQSGLLNNADLQYLFSALPIAAGSKGTAAFTPPAPLTADGRNGDVIVEAGAQLTAPTTDAKVGGRIALIGANVRNDGTISTPDGQTILAAGLQVGLTAHPSSDPSLRGLDVYVGSVGSYGGTVINTGEISIPRASASLVGADIRQLGAIDSSTSVSLNGRIDLIASYDAVANAAYDAANASKGLPYFNRKTGSIQLGAGSTMRILPELASTEKAVGTELALRSQLNLQGKTIYFEGGSSLLAPNAKVTAQAGDWAYAPPTSRFVYSGGQIYLDAASFIDVSGTTGVLAPLSQNILTVQLRGAELANSPLQRDQLLRATLLTIDIRKTGTYGGRNWVGTPLGDATGFAGLIERSVGQLTSAGGSVDLQAGDSIVLQKGSIVDVSGGWVRYESGFVQTTRVLYNGRLVDISAATPDRIYDGIYTGVSSQADSRWRAGKVFANPLALSGRRWEDSYFQGANGGQLTITAPAMALDGELLGNTISGARQIRPTASTSEAADPSRLTLAFKGQQNVGPNYFITYPTPPAIVFREGTSLPEAGAFSVDASGNPAALSASRLKLVELSPELLTSKGFGVLTIDNSDGSITVPQGVTLQAPAGGTISLTAANINVDGSVQAPGGALVFKALNISPYVSAVAASIDPQVVPLANAGRGNVNIGATAHISTAGLLVDDRPGSETAMALPVIVDGGSVDISGYTVNLSKGAVIDVSGGAGISATGKKYYGDAGAISIKGGQDPNLLSVVGGKLALGAELSGYAGGEGGSLTIQAPLIQAGGSTDSRRTLLIDPAFFSQGGFSHITLNGIGEALPDGKFVPGLVIAPDTSIAPVRQGAVAVSSDGKGHLALVPADRPANDLLPVSLSFAAVGARDAFSSTTVTIRGDLVLGERAEIHTLPEASVSLAGDTVTVLGAVYAPGGSITVKGATNSLPLFLEQSTALATVYLGPQSVLSTAGTTVLTPDPYGRRTGSVLPGGSISVSGNIVAARGALLDVSGASDWLDVHPLEAAPESAYKLTARSGVTASLYELATVRTRVDSDGGTITLAGGQMLFTDATLLGRAGGPGASGGTLIVSSGRFYPSGGTPAPYDTNLVVTQNDNTGFTDTRVGQAVRDLAGNLLAGQGYFGVDDFQQGGFDSLKLKGSVQFKGPVTIHAAESLSVADGGVLYSDSEVRLTAPYVALGMAFPTPQKFEDMTNPFGVGAAFQFAPTFGPGSLIVEADLIDVGTLSLQNIGKASLVAENGDIRGSGTFNMAGDLVLRAGQVYPVTASPFTITAYDHGGVPGSVTIQAAGVRPLPLSAGGRLSIYASTIQQNGVLRAPFGTINLGWDGTDTAPVNLIAGSSITLPTTRSISLGAGSVTSVSAIDPISGQGVLIPYGLTVDGNSWIDPAGTDISAIGAPSKSITIAGQALSVASGATLDIRGGGDLLAYRWVSGNGGTVDILGQTGSFAIIPGFDSVSPIGAFNNRTAAAAALGNDPGYVNNTLSVGDRVYLSASPGLAAGSYTLLPARYALLPGAFLVTPQGGTPTGNVTLPDGSSIVSGYLYNGLNTSRKVSTLSTRFEVLSQTVIAQRAEYETYLATSFLRALAPGGSTARLPDDAGQLILQATQSMAFAGTVQAKGWGTGRGGLIDVASSSPINIIAPNGTAIAGALNLDSSMLSSFGAESLLIGGVRQIGSSGTTVSVKTSSIRVDNAGAPLSAPDLILVSKGSIELAAGSSLLATGTIGTIDTLLLGSSSVAGSGDGTLVRVSNGIGGGLVRSGVSNSTTPLMTLAAGASVSGLSLILDSTSRTSLSPDADLHASYVSLNSGQISLLFDNPGTLQSTTGLVLAGGAFQDLSSAKLLSLLSYSSIDIYGTGSFATSGALELHAAQIRGFNAGGGAVVFSASSVLLDNSPGRSSLAVLAPASGKLEFIADTIQIGSNQLAVDQYSDLRLTTTGGLSFSGTGGLTAQGNIVVTAPRITAASQSTQSLVAGGNLSLFATSTGSMLTSGLGASLTLQGQSVASYSDIVLPSGLLTLRATSGDLTVGGLLDVSGTEQRFFDVFRYTDAGDIVLKADAGSVNLLAGSSVDVSAVAGGGDAGSLEILTPQGSFTLGGGLRGYAGAGGSAGEFRLDVGSLASLGTINARLNNAGFTESRSFRVRSGNVLVDGLAVAHEFALSADLGSITVTGTIDASGVTGGEISLEANGSVTLASGSLLTVAAQDFDNAGKGGEVTIEAGSQRNGVVGTGTVDIGSGSTIDLSVASKTAASESYGKFSGKLHLRAPQNSTRSDLSVAAINGTIVDASSILIEGYRLYDLTGTGTITSSVQNTINSDAQTFLGAAGTTSANYTAMMNRLLANNAALASVVVLAPGAEIINRTGDLTLGTTSSTATSDWNLATFRYGAKRAPGVLTLRAAGNITLYNAISDGFATSAYNSALLARSSLLPVNTQSWSYRFTAGADLSAADFHRVLPVSVLGASSGSLQLGKDYGANTFSNGTSALTSTAVATRFQVIRTGSGDIDISAGRNIRLLNQFASIYTAGTQVSDPTLGGTFDLPILDESGGAPVLGAVQQNPTYPAQFTMAGGNISLNAQENIEHLTKISGQLVADSQKELPNNWLYRRGYVDPATGEFGKSALGEIASTAWWVDFSNFFQGIGALGGGNISMTAGRDISNVDAVIPTNARMAGKDSAGNAIAPDANNLVELGGGDLVVKTGRNLDAGVYYVERGAGTLDVGGEITTNSTRSPSLVYLSSQSNAVSDSLTWLPTTLFIGRGGFDINARGNALLGPAVNTFLMPGGYNNTYWYKTYFSTYDSDSYVKIASLGGSVTMREAITLSGNTAGSSVPILFNYLQKVHLLTSSPASTSFYQPWLRLDESSVTPFRSLTTVMPGTLDITSFSGNINLVGSINLSPSPSGNLSLLASKAINGLQANGSTLIGGVKTTTWGTASINLSDADPSSIPGITSPFAYQAVADVGIVQARARSTGSGFLTFVDNLFRESGSTTGALQTKQALHDSDLLHDGDSEPARIYALAGDISGLEYYSAKASQILAGRDITDVAFYLQNVNADDVSVVSSGRDIILYNASTALRLAASRTGNILNLNALPLAGDIQIAGPGVLEVLAGRDLDLGSGANNSNGTGVGITSVGNAKNPYLSYAGAQLIIGAGLGSAGGLADSLNVDDFLAKYAEGNGGAYASVIAEELNGASISSLSDEAKARIALKILYLALRDAGRNFQTEGISAYQSGFAAIESLFGELSAERGDITLRSRDIRTKQGGDISIFAPSGKLTLANTALNTLIPPGIVTESGGNIGIFTRGDVSLGIGRIFTLRGGNQIIWSSEGDIAAGSAAKTVTFAPPTRVILDPQSADVQTDLAGLATGGGIGVLATVAGVEPGEVDLIAPNGAVDAGDAGIRATGAISIAAVEVRNADNIAAPQTTGVPTSGPPAAVAAPAPPPSNPTAANNAAATNVADQARQQSQESAEVPSIITVDVLGYGGGEGEEDDNSTGGDHSAAL